MVPRAFNTRFLKIVFDSAEIFNFLTFPCMLSQRLNHFRICSASDEIRAAHAQAAMKFVLRMLSQLWNLFRTCSAYFRMMFFKWVLVSSCINVETVKMSSHTEHMQKFVRCSVCDDSVFTYAQCAIKLISRMLSVRLNSFRVCSACAWYNFRKFLKNTKLKCKFRL
jgi:hypothetical protein